MRSFIAKNKATATAAHGSPLFASFLGRSTMVIALVWLSRWEPMVIDLVQPSAGNAICVMGFNFLETDHPWFLTVTTSLVGWISGRGEPNPKTCIPVWNTFGTTTLGFHPPPIWSSQWWLVGLACGTPWVCHTGLLLLGWQLLGGLLHLGSPALGPWWLDRSWRL